MNKISFLVAVIFSALMAVSCMMPPPKDANKPPRTVTVSGTGTVSVQADIATINFSVVTMNRSVIEASRQNADIVSNVRKALVDAGCGADAIVTDRYTINQDISYRNGIQIRGDYRVSNSVHIVVRNIANIGNMVDAAVNAGANEFSSIDFSVSDIEGAIREARTAAIKQAYEAANLMVKTAGSELGQIISIEEQRQGGAVMTARAMNNVAFADVSNAETSVTPGKQKISVSVLCTYEIQ